MDFSIFLDGFVKIDIWISQSCCRDLSKLIHGPQETLLTPLVICGCLLGCYSVDTREYKRKYDRV